MRSRDEFEFVLFPWENRGAPFDPRPDLVESATIQGHERLFLLKVRANRVFFRLAEDATRVWATTAQIEGSPIAFWKRELEARRIARLFAHKARLDLQWYHVRTQMGALINDDSEVWLCEWCSDVWWPGRAPLVLQKYVRTHRKLGIWQPQWQPPLHKLFNQNAGQMFERSMPESERTATSLRWLCGSEKQLGELLQNLCLAQFDALCKIERDVSRLYPSRYEWGHFDFELRSDSIDSDASLKFGWLGTRGKPEILEAFLKYNYVTGVRWERGHANSVRGEWYYSPFVCSFRFEKKQPTVTQRDQARAHLRHWLQDKVAAYKIEEWLTPR